MMEAAVVLMLTPTGGHGESEFMPLYWHLPPKRSLGALPDSRDLWSVIWENRRWVYAIAHSHPGSGWTGPSHTDLTTFAAIEAALGSRLDWPIVTSDRVVTVGWDTRAQTYVTERAGRMYEGTGWLRHLREISNY